MRMNRDGTLEAYNMETRLLEFDYPDPDRTIGGVAPTIRVSLVIDGEFRRELLLRQDDEIVSFDPKDTIRVARAMIKGAKRAQREEKQMTRAQDADEKRLDLRRLKDLQRRESCLTGPSLNQSEVGELEKLAAKYK